MTAFQAPHDVSVCVCIPTFNRPDGLRIALDGLCAQDLKIPFAVVVANNLPGDSRVGAVIDAFKDRLDVHLTDVTERGVSAVRNQAIAVALAQFPALQWIAFQDDDEVAAPGWLSALINTGVQWDGDLIGGAVTAHGQDSSAVSALRHTYRKPPNGPVALLAGTNSLLVKADFIRGAGRDLFRLDYGASGGEDYEMFRFAAKRQAKMIWSNDAVINEYWPAERSQLKTVLKREFNKGLYMARVDLEYDGALKTAVASARALASIIRLKAPSLRAVPVLVALKLYFFAGRLAGQLGAQSGAYAR